MQNDHYGEASHGPDVAFAVPVFLHNTLIGWSVTTAHRLDIEALSPGSCGIVDAVDTYADRLQFKAIKVYDRGHEVNPVWYIQRANIRAPDLVVGDREAQVKAATIGAERLLALMQTHGPNTLMAAAEDPMGYSEHLLRDATRALPDGSYRATTHINGYLDDPDPTRRLMPIVATVTVHGVSLTIGLTGTAPQLPDTPINMPLVGTVDCTIWLTIRSILLNSAVHGPVPQNEGLTRPVTILAPLGCLANPISPPRSSPASAPATHWPTP